MMQALLELNHQMWLQAPVLMLMLIVAWVLSMLVVAYVLTDMYVHLSDWLKERKKR